MLSKTTFLIAFFSIAYAATIPSFNTMLTSPSDYLAKPTTVDIDKSIQEPWDGLETTSAPLETVSYLSYTGYVYIHSFVEVTEVTLTSIPSDGNPPGIRFPTSETTVASATLSAARPEFSGSSSGLGSTKVSSASSTARQSNLPTLSSRGRDVRISVPIIGAVLTLSCSFVLFVSIQRRRVQK